MKNEKKFKWSMQTVISVLLMLFVINSVSANPFSRKSFNDNWLFKKGALVGAEQVDFNDDNWRKLDLPHDWAIEGPFDKKYNARNGGLPVFGTAWYRKSFTLPSDALDKVVSVTFDGAMDNSSVYVNGKLVGERPFGYIAFSYDISEFIKADGSENIIAVRLAPKNYSARWYPGAGLYRNTYLEIKESVHLANWGATVTTPTITKQRAYIKLVSKINNYGKAVPASVISELKRADGKLLQRQVHKISYVSANASEVVEQTFFVKNPIFWDIDNPYRYYIETTVKRQAEVVDMYTTQVGIRQLEFKADDGFWLNGRRVQIQGVCLHHDNGPLGAAVNVRAIERKFEIMKEMGVNAIRTSHNPPSAEFVEVADRMGMLLQVEAFDSWKMPKNKVVNGYDKHFDQWHERDLRDMVIQNRNSPSIIMWSTGNEVMEQKAAEGWKLAKKLSDIIKSEDPTRLVTNGLSMYPSFIDGKMAEQVDIVGLNYKAGIYQKIHKKHPEWLLLGSETSSVVSTRGVYHFPLEKYKKHPSKYLTSYDIITPPWAYIPDFEFQKQAENPAVMGEFVWTGFDYLGEPTPYGGRDHDNKAYWNVDWPARSSSFGAVDLAGFKKDRFYLYQSQWTKKPMVHLLPHWTWPEKEGDEIPVMVYTNAEQVELFLNGKSLGRKTKGVDTVALPIKVKYDAYKLNTFNSPYRLGWQVKYQPGELKAVAYRNGKVVAKEIINTAGAPVKIELMADRNAINADGQDLSFITVLIKDKDGNLCPTANSLINFTLTGNGEIAAVGNGDSVTTAPFNANYRKAFNGKALLVVKGQKKQMGTINVTAMSEGLKSDSLSIKTQ